MSWNVEYAAQSKEAAIKRLQSDEHGVRDAPPALKAAIIAAIEGLPERPGFAFTVKTNGHLDAGTMAWGGNGEFRVGFVQVVE